MSNGHSHRPTLKQSNKGFKSKHSSKGSLKAAAKGKVGSPSGQNSHKNVTVSSKKSRLNANAQKREAKRKDVVHDVKFFSTSSGGGAVPRIISVVPLLPSISPKRFLRNLVDTLGLPQQELEELLPTLQDRGTYVIRAPRFKTNVQINLLPPLTVFSTLDAALVSDYVVLLLSSVDEVQLEGEAVLRCLQAQAGGVEIVSCVQVRNESDDLANMQAPEDRPIVPSTKQLIHKSLLSFTTYFFPSVAKIHSSDTPAEAALLARALCEAAPGGTRHNEDVRAYMVAEGSGGVKWTANADNEDSGRLEIVATVRGGRLSADRLVHIPGRGDFQVESILAAPPSSLSIAAKPHHAMSVDAPMEPLSVPTDKADDLTAENTPDPLANEQTWPTEEEMGGSNNGASGPSREGVRTKRVPKGTSAYQAAWIFDDEDGEDDDDDDDEDDDDEMDDDEAPQLEERFSGDEETEEIELDSRRSELHRDLDPEQEEEEYRAYMKEREKAQRDNEMYPDEIDTPKHISARTRFQRYRGLKSFRTSPWDPYENLPEDYAKIFQFENFNATSKRIEREGRAEGVSPGSRVVVILKDVPRSVAEERDQSLPFIVHGLLQHEHKTSVLHFLVQRNTEFTEPVKAKEPLVLCVGPRRYLINPIFSQHVRGGGRGVNNVHKSEKFLRAGGAMVVTTFGPVCFGKSPCILLRDEGEGEVPSLVAMGSSLPPDPTRIIAKRIILTGHPLKIHKKTATIRYMFFERDDVEYFKSVELHTKYGKVGHISEALGTHGYFKAHFDAPIGQMDTICMNLYKRQFPKWAKPYTPTEVPTLVEMDEDME